MTSHTYSGNYTTGISLSSFNPVYITGNILAPLNNGIYGNNTQAWTVGNTGTIESNAAGVYLKAGGKVTNGAPSARAALISGFSNGIYITGAPGTVVNDGTIDGTGASSDGVNLHLGGNVTNGGMLAPAAVISGYVDGIGIGAAGTVTNDGTVEGTGTNSLGVYLQHGGNVTNGAAGVPAALISGDVWGIFIYAAVGTVTNDGRIESTGTSGTGVDLQHGGNVTNGGKLAPAALIAGYRYGVFGGAGGTVTNDGTIEGTGTLGKGVFLDNGGIVTNGAAGVPAALISGYFEGVHIGGAVGTVVNDGTIKGTGALGNGVFLDAGGNVTNGGAGAPAALISGYVNGIYITGAVGTVTNDGTIESSGTGALGDGVFLDADGNATNGGLGVPTALIAGYNDGVFIGAVGTVTNDGTIEGTGAFGHGVFLDAGGKVTNGAAGVTAALISGYFDGIYIAGAVGTVTNDGTIKGAGANGAFLDAGGNVTNGRLAPAALISGYSDGIYIAGAAGSTVTNDGTIEGIGTVGNGVFLDAGGNVINGGPGVTTALISGYDLGIVSDATCTVVNDGTIEGNGTLGNGVFLDAGGNVTNGGPGVTTALISGYDHGIVSGTTGTVVNNGTIEGTGASGNGVYLDGGGTVTNGTPLVTTALIAGYANGILNKNAVGRITNHGTIEALGASGVGVAFVGTFVNTLTNAGRIGGADGTAVSFGAGNDLLIVDAGAVFTGVVDGGGGVNEVDFAAAGTDNASGFTGFETIVLASTGANSLTVANANFTGVTGSTIAVDGGNAGNTVDASGLTGTNRVIVTGGAGTDHFTGGAGNDIFKFSAANLSNSDTMKGGAGSNELLTTSAGTITASGVSAVETFKLATGGANHLTLTSANFTGVAGHVITVDDGNSGNTIVASTLPSADAIIVHAGTGTDTLKGGAGNDIFFAGGKTTMTGRAGKNQFTFADVGANTITDFSASASNELVLRNSGFNLGVDQGLGTGTPKRLAASAFVANSTGAFTNTSQRFAYNTTTGALSYSADGSGSAGSKVVTLTGHPALSAGSAGNLFFTS